MDSDSCANFFVLVVAVFFKSRVFDLAVTVPFCVRGRGRVCVFTPLNCESYHSKNILPEFVDADLKGLRSALCVLSPF